MKYKRLGCGAAIAVLAIAIVLALILIVGVLTGWTFPTHDQAKLKTIAAEAQHLMETHPGDWVQIPRREWPPMIASLKPFDVSVGPRAVDITMKMFFDGGWGYGVARNKRDLPMLPECWSELGQSVYWHGPC